MRGRTLWLSADLSAQRQAAPLGWETKWKIPVLGIHGPSNLWPSQAGPAPGDQGRPGAAGACPEVCTTSHEGDPR